MVIKYYELLKVKEIETGSGYSKHLENREATIKKSINLENLIKEFESKYPLDKQDWILLPKHLLKENPFNYQDYDYCIVPSVLGKDDMIEGIDYVEGKK